MNRRPIGFGNPQDRIKQMQTKHDRTAHLIVRGGAMFAIIWVLWALVGIALTGGVVYVAWHFISKFW